MGLKVRSALLRFLDAHLASKASSSKPVLQEAVSERKQILTLHQRTLHIESIEARNTLWSDNANKFNLRQTLCKISASTGKPGPTASWAKSRIRRWRAGEMVISFGAYTELESKPKELRLQDAT